MAQLVVDGQCDVAPRPNLWVRYGPHSDQLYIPPISSRCTQPDVKLPRVLAVEKPGVSSGQYAPSRDDLFVECHPPATAQPAYTHSTDLRRENANEGGEGNISKPV